MRRLLAALISMCVLLFLLTSSSVGWAAPGTPSQRAEAATKEATSLEKAGKKEEALTKYEEAYALAPTGNAAYLVARLEAGFGRHALALPWHRWCASVRAITLVWPATMSCRA